MFMRVSPMFWLPDMSPVRNSVATKLHSSLCPCFDTLLPSFLLGGDAAQRQRRVDQTYVGERLGEVAQRLPGVGIELLGEQANVVGACQKVLEHGSRPIDLTRKGQRLDRPE